MAEIDKPFTDLGERFPKTREEMDALRAAGAQVGLNPTEAGELMAKVVASF